MLSDALDYISLLPIGELRHAIRIAAILTAIVQHLDAFSEVWFLAKLVLVIGLSGYQGWLAAYGKRLAAGKRPLENRTLRIMNEVPGIAAALIVVLVIVRPF